MTTRWGPILLIGAAMAGLAAAALAAYAARTFYFRAKIAALQPVRLDIYAADNARLSVPPRPPATPLRLVLIGDSRVAQWSFRDNQDRWHVVNRGIGGETSAQLLLRFESDALRLQPHTIVVQTGINDLVAAMGQSNAEADVTRERVLRNLQSAAIRGAQAGTQVIVTTIVPPSSPPLVRRLVWRNRIYRDVAWLNTQLLEWAAPSGVRVLDLSETLHRDARLAPEFASDTLHLNAQGYERLSALLNAILPAESESLAQH